MLDRTGILALIPHQGAMCLLDRALAWDAAHIECESRSHLAPANPLRQHGRLGASCGIEYGLQAAALHGALLAGGGTQPAGFVAALRGVRLHFHRLDEPRFGVLRIVARREGGGSSSQAYAFKLVSADDEM